MRTFVALIVAILMAIFVFNVVVHKLGPDIQTTIRQSQSKVAK